MKKRSMQRGFNLVEMSIILAVVGLVLGAVIIPTTSLFQDDVYEREMRRLEDIKTAVVGYAVRNRTLDDIEGGLNVRVGFPAYYNRRHPIPRGRPYLPCPDITGDGYEDRFLADPTGFAIPITTTLAARFNARGFVFFGSCYASRGVLPWRTLGVPPADHWGNLYTYQVDGIFADALVGFNKDSAIDIYDSRSFSEEAPPSNSITYGYALRSTEVTTLTLFGLAATASMRPAVVCRSEPCGTLGINLDLAAGKQTAGAFNVLFKRFNANAIVEGVPFVVVSHGKNGFGAVNYARNIADKTSATTPVAPGGVICNEPVDGSTNNTTTVTLSSPEAHNFPHPEPPTADSKCRPASVNGVPTLDGFLFYGRRGDDFDDVVAWMTREELFNMMRRTGVLDAPDSPIYFPHSRRRPPTP